MAVHTGSVFPGLAASKIIWPMQAPATPTASGLVIVVANASIAYNIQTPVVVTAIMEWNIGVPVSGRIIQTSQDRTDFAY